MENKLKGGKADNMTPQKIADKFGVNVSDVKKQIKKGKKIESEHTDDEEKQNEIASDHVAEFPDYYDRIMKMEKEAEKHWAKKEKTNESKLLIKKLLRENLNNSLEFKQELDEGKLGDLAKAIIYKTKDKTKAFAKAAAFCSALVPQIGTTTGLAAAGVAATTVSCQKVKPAVYKFSYGTEVVAETTSTNQYTTLPTDDGGTMTLQPYAAKTRGSWYLVIDNKDLQPNGQLSEKDRLELEEKLYLQEKARLEGNNANYTITDYKLEYMGESKRGDIATTNGKIG